MGIILQDVKSVISRQSGEAVLPLLVICYHSCSFSVPPTGPPSQTSFHYTNKFQDMSLQDDSSFEM